MSTKVSQKTGNKATGSTIIHKSNTSAAGNKGVPRSRSYGFMRCKTSKFSPVRFLKHLGGKLARGLHVVSMKIRQSPKVSSSSGRSKPFVTPVDSHRTAFPLSLHSRKMSSPDADQRRRDWFHQALGEYLSMVVCKEPRFLVNDGFKQLDKIYAGGHTPALKNIPQDSGIADLVSFSETHQTTDGWENHLDRTVKNFINGVLDYSPVSPDKLMGRPQGTTATYLDTSSGKPSFVSFEVPEGKVIIGIEVIDARGDGKNGWFSLVEASTYHARFEFTPASFERQEWHVRLYYVDPLDFDKSAEEQYRHQVLCEARRKLAEKADWMKNWMKGEFGVSGQSRLLGFTSSSSLDAAYSSDLRSRLATWKTEKWSLKSLESLATNPLSMGHKNSDIILTPPSPTDTLVGFEVTCNHAGGALVGGTRYQVVEVGPKKLHVWLETPYTEDTEWSVTAFFVDSRLYH